jgi:hypothetical protein
MSGLIQEVQIIMLPAQDAIQKSNDIQGGEEDETISSVTGCIAGDGCWCAGIGVGLSESK